MADPDRTSVAVGRKGGPGRGLLFLLLALIVLILLIVLLLGSCGGDDDDSATTSTPVATATATPQPTPEATPATGGASADGSGTLTAGGTSLLGTGASAAAGNVGTDAIGDGIEVLSLADGGFFVGTDDSDRIYVEFGGKVGEDEPGSDRPKVGTRVNLTGPLEAAPEDPVDALKLGTEDAQAVTDRGAYINADTVTPTDG